MFSKLGLWLTCAVGFLKRALVIAFGRINWQRPPWFSAILEKIKLVPAWIKVHPKCILKWSGAVIFLAAIITAGFIWYKHLPKIIKVGVDVTAPGLTKLVDDKWVVEPVVVNFKKSVVPLEDLNKPVASGIEMNPAIEGEWKWQGDNKLVFTPKPGVDWPVGEEFRIKIAKEGFVAKHVTMEKYELEFKTAPFGANLTKAEFYQDPADPKMKKVVATVTFTHPVDTADFDKRVTLNLKGVVDKSYPSRISYDKYKLNAFIYSDPVEIPKKDGAMVIEIDSDARALKGGAHLSQKLERSVVIPGLYDYFRVNSALLTFADNERGEPEQILIVESNAGVEEKEINRNVSAFRLPVHHPDKNEDDGTEPYYWTAEKVGADILKISEPIKLGAIATDRDAATLHSYKYSAPVGSYVYVKVAKGVKSFGGYILAKDFDQVLRVPEFRKELKIMHNGSILSLSGERKVALYSRDVPGVKFEVGRILPDEIQHLVTQSEGDFGKPEFFNYSFNQENISEYFSEVRALSDAPPGTAQYFAFDLNKYLDAGGRRGLFLLKAQSYDAKKKIATGSGDTRLILVTDLGILVKEASDSSSDVFIQSINSGEPVGGATVQLIGKNGLSVLTETTNEGGHAHFPVLESFKRGEAPTLYLVQKDGDLSFIPYSRRDRVLNMSRFDVGGVMTSTDPGRLSAYLFSDRGIYRPGDEIIAGMIVRPQVWGQNLKDIPLEAVVTDSRGLTVKREKLKLSASGFEELRYQTQETSPTGTYGLSLYIVKDGKQAGLIGSATVKVQEFLPDTLKISARLSNETPTGWVSPEGLKGHVTLQNLFGTPATDRVVRAKINLSPVTMLFGALKDYTFFDPMKANEGFTEDLEETKTNENGEAEFDLNLQKFARATYRLRFNAEGFGAQGGRSVGAERSVIVSPLAFMAGYKADGDLHYITKGSKRSVELIAIDSAVQKIEAKDLKILLIEQKYVSVLTKQDDNTYKYESIKKETVVSEKPLTIPPKGMVYALETSEPGTFAVEVRDKDGLTLNRIEYAVAGRANLARSLEKNAELEIVLNKSDFAPGEEMELQIKAPYTGAGLITIERDRIYKYQWFKADTTSSVQKITLPQNLEGNGYVSVSFVRDFNSDEIFMSPLSYGVAPFSVSLGRRSAKITLTAPELARPGDPYVIKYKTDRPSKIVIFAVDEGILQVAGYKTPDPLGFFFKKRALQVKTSQILDLILPEFKRLLNLSAPGGDEEGAFGKNLNPFKRRQDKPVAFWSGIIDADQKAREVKYDIPDYFNGAMRVMAVAVAGDAIGVAQKKALVRGDFVIGPNVPTTVAPGDEFEVSASVANNVAGSGENAEVLLALTTSEHLEVVGETQATMKIGEMKEGSAKFKLKAKDILGSGSMTFTASMGDKSSKRAIDLSVRPAVPFRTDLQTGYFKNGSTDVSALRRMYKEFRTLTAGISPLPLGLARGLTDYLAKFPYGCTEQLVSEAMPAVVLKNRPDFGYAPEKVDEIISGVLATLSSRQNADGAFGIWASGPHVSDFASVYAMHFLIEAKEKNVAVPSEMIGSGMKWLAILAQSEAKDIYAQRVKAYAIYLLTRNGNVTSNFVSDLQQDLDENYKDEWQKDLAGVYLAASLKLMKQDRLADNIIAQYKLGEPHKAYYEEYYDGLIHDSTLVYILAKHFPQKLKNVSGLAIDSIAGYIKKGTFNTLSSSYSILALDAYVETAGNLKMEDISAGEVLSDGSVRPLVIPGGLFPVMDFSDSAKAIRFTNGGDINVFYSVTEAGFDLALPTEEIKQGVEVLREYTDSAGKPAGDVTLGSEIEAHVKIRSLSGPLYNVAVVDLLPGGFEVVYNSKASSDEEADDSAETIEADCGAPSDAEGEGDEADCGDADVEYEDDYEYVSPIGIAEKSTWPLEYADVREDRIILYGYLDDKVKEFVYKIKATNAGQFTVPPTFGESMYDRAVKAQGLGGKITVTNKAP